MNKIQKIHGFKAYQELAHKTADFPSHLNSLYPTLGLVGEAGEVANKVKKIYRDKGGRIDPDTLTELEQELGDVLWYLAELATQLGLSLEEIAAKNIVKLNDRQKRGVIRGDGDNR